MRQPLSSCKDKMNPIRNWVIRKAHSQMRILSHGEHTLRFLSMLKSDDSFEPLSEMEDEFRSFPLRCYGWNDTPKMHQYLMIQNERR